MKNDQVNSGFYHTVVMTAKLSSITLSCFLAACAAPMQGQQPSAPVTETEPSGQVLEADNADDVKPALREVEVVEQAPAETHDPVIGEREPVVKVEPEQKTPAQKVSVKKIKENVKVAAKPVNKKSKKESEVPEPASKDKVDIVELISVQAEKVIVPQANMPSVTLRASDLPKSYSLWTLQRNWDKQHPKECRLSTPTMQIGQGAYAFQVWLALQENRLLVSASANIDMGRSGVGVRFDGGDVKSFTKSVFPTQVAIEEDLTSMFFNAKDLDVYLGGPEFGDKVQHARVELHDMKKAIPALKACQAL